LNSDEDKRRFNTILVEAILEGIDFGEVVLRFLELNFNLERDKIAETPELFAYALEKTLGPWMAEIFERNILRILCERISIEYPDIEDLTFAEEVKRAYEKYLKKNSP